MRWKSQPRERHWAHIEVMVDNHSRGGPQVILCLGTAGMLRDQIPGLLSEEALSYQSYCPKSQRLPLSWMFTVRLSFFCFLWVSEGSSLFKELHWILGDKCGLLSNPRY